MPERIDISFRPETYFRPRALERYLLTKVKGAVLRKQLLTLLEEGRHDEVNAVLTTEGVSPVDRKILESFHPMFMGGNYLPDLLEGEVEIGRICIASTTFDVTSARARMDRGTIVFRVVDEYGGDTLQDAGAARTDKPMTLGEFTDMFLNAWPLFDVLEMNFEDDLQASLDFFTCESEFYPDFDALCRERVIDRFRHRDPDDFR